MSMQKTAKSSLVLIDSFSFTGLAGLLKPDTPGEFYQQFMRGFAKGTFQKQTVKALGDRLIVLAEHTYSLRQMDAFERIAEILLNVPLGNEYQRLARYFQALCIFRKGKVITARALLEAAADNIPPRFKARALLSVAATYYHSNDFVSFLKLCTEAQRAASSRDWFDPRRVVISQRNTALYKSLEGDHRGAVAGLEKLFPLTRALAQEQPYLFYEHLNSLAVELGEVGRIEEARNICKITLASPYAFAYPEWRETSDDIERKGYRQSRSAVSFLQKKPGNLLYLSDRERPEGLGVVRSTNPET